MNGIPGKEIACMPIGALSDLLDAMDIMNDLADEDNVNYGEYIPDLR